MIPINLSKQEGLDADPRAIHQINFTAYLDRTGNATVFFIIEKSKRNHFIFFTMNCESVVNVFQNFILF